MSTFTNITKRSRYFRIDYLLSICTTEDPLGPEGKKGLLRSHEKKKKKEFRNIFFLTYCFLLRGVLASKSLVPKLKKVSGVAVKITNFIKTTISVKIIYRIMLLYWSFSQAILTAYRNENYQHFMSYKKYLPFFINATFTVRWFTMWRILVQISISCRCISVPKPFEDGWSIYRPKT